MNRDYIYFFIGVVVFASVFSYCSNSHSYEIEARENESEYCKLNYTECVRTGESVTAYNPNFRK